MMDPDIVAILGFATLFALMLLRAPVGMAMGLVGVAGFGLIAGFGPAFKLIGQTSMRTVRRSIIALHSRGLDPDRRP